MAPRKNPPAKMKKGLFCCPSPGCSWTCKCRTSYSRHIRTKHSLSFKYICERCTAGHHLLTPHKLHVKKCMGTMEGNMARRGKKPTFADGYEVREAFRPAEEEAIQELEEMLGGKEREIEELKADKEELQRENWQLVTKVAELQAKLKEVGGRGQEETVQEQEEDEVPELVEEPEVDEARHVDKETVMEVDMEAAVALEQDDLDLVLSEEEEEDNMELEERLEDTLQVDPPLRRSTRKCPSTRRREQQEDMEDKLLVTNDTQHGLKIQIIPGKGRAVVATRSFVKGEFVLEYDGILMDKGTASIMENTYSMDVSKGCFMFYFLYNKKQYCLDATEESGRYGRLINHSRKNPTCYPKVVTVNGTPRLIFRAKSDLMPGQEVQYDYGDRSAKSILAFPWLAG